MSPMSLGLSRSQAQKVAKYANCRLENVGDMKRTVTGAGNLVNLTVMKMPEDGMEKLIQRRPSTTRLISDI